MAGLNDADFRAAVVQHDDTEQGWCSVDIEQWWCSVDIEQWWCSMDTEQWWCSVDTEQRHRVVVVQHDDIAFNKFSSSAGQVYVHVCHAHHEILLASA